MQPSNHRTNYPRLVFLIIFLFLFSSAIKAELKPTNTLKYEASQGSPNAKITDLQWLQGYWQGIAWGGKTEEIWSEPLGASMMGAFKFVDQGQVKFYELITLSEDGNSLVLRLKHFSSELKGWESKDDYIEFKLVKLAENIAYFDGYTYQLVSPDELHVYVVIENQGEKKETQFIFTRRHKTE